MLMLKLSLDFLKSLTTLPSERLKKVPKLVQMLGENPNLPSLHLKHLAVANLCSARLDDAYRAIIAQRGADYVLLRVDKHDEAYRWAERDAVSSPSMEFPIEIYESAVSDLALVDDASPDRNLRLPIAQVNSSLEIEGLRVGSIHSWAKLIERFSWDQDKHGYLQERVGCILCACLQAAYNPSAPWEILPGKSPSHIRKADMLSRQSSPIPVFIKQAENQREYWGLFRFERCEKDPATIRSMLPKNRMEDTSMILYLAEVG